MRRVSVCFNEDFNFLSPACARVEAANPVHWVAACRDRMNLQQKRIKCINPQTTGCCSWGAYNYTASPVQLMQGLIAAHTAGWYSFAGLLVHTAGERNWVIEGCCELDFFSLGITRAAVCCLLLLNSQLCGWLIYIYFREMRNSSVLSLHFIANNVQCCYDNIMNCISFCK